MNSNTRSRSSIHDIIRDSNGTGHSATLTHAHPKYQNMQSLPQVGLLYQTITPSPIVKWILPARIRSVALNDVLFVGEDFVHLRTILPQGEVRHVASKTDFRSRIRSANVIGDKVAIHDPSIDHDLDPTIKDEVDIELEDTLEAAIPSHLLVCAMEDGDLMFLYVKQQNGALEFIEIREPMPRETSLARQPGSNIVVDQKNNIIAVAAHTNTIMIYKMKPWDKVAQELESYRQRPRVRNKLLCTPQGSPVYRGHAFLAVKTDPDATILHIAFLHNDSGDSSPILVLIVRTRNRTKLVVYQSHDSTDFSVPIINGQSLSEDAPQLLVPFQNKSAFFLVCPERIILYPDILTKSPNPESYPIHPSQFPHAPPLVSTAELPVYTAWVSTARSSKSKRESMFLLREDGYLFIVEDDGSPTQSIQIDVCGRLLCSGPSALAYILLTNSLSDPESVIAGGCLSDGQVARLGLVPQRAILDVKPRVVAMKLRILQNFPNWSPSMDCEISSTESGGQGSSEGLFLTTGRQPYSCLTEMRFGHEAKVINNAFLGDNLLGATGLWALRVPSDLGILLYFISTPQDTEIFYHDTYEDEIYSLQVEHLEGPTLAVIALQDDLLLRVSSNSIILYRISSRQNDDSENPELQLIPMPGPEDHKVGDLVSFGIPVPTSGLLVASEFDSGESRIGICTIQQEADESPGWKFEASKDVYNYTMTCATMLDHPDFGLHALIGGPGGIRDCVKISGPQMSTMIRLEGKGIFSDHTSAPSTAAESLAVLPVLALEVEGNTMNYAVLCGTRQGSLQIFWLQIQEDSYALHLHETLSIGDKPISIQIVPELPVAFVISENDVFRLELSKVGGFSYSVATSRIWFSDNNSFNTNFPQTLNPLIHVDTLSHYENKDPSNTMISVFSAGNLSIAEVQGTKGPVPRKISLVLTPSTPSNSTEVSSGVEEPGTPHIVVALKDSDLIAVGASRWEFFSHNTTRSPKKSHRQRHVRGVIHFVDKSVLRGGLDRQAKPDTKFCVAFAPGERVMSIHDWPARVLNSDDRTFRYIMVGTSYHADDPRYPKGKLYFLLSKWSGRDLRQISIQEIKSLASPVNAVTALDSYRLAILHGTSLQVWGLRIEAGKPKFSLYAETTLFDRGHKMTTNWPYIYISTFSQSFVTYEYVETAGGDYTNRKDELHKFIADSQSRQATSHLPIKLVTPGDTSTSACLDHAVLLSDKSGGLTLLSHPYGINSADFIAPISRAPMIGTTMPRMISRLSYAPKTSRFVRTESSIKSIKQREIDISMGKYNPPFVGQHVIGTSPSGAIIEIKFLDKDPSILLKFLENLLNWIECIKDTLWGQRPGLYKMDTVVIDPLRRVYPTRANYDHWPNDMAVNGDRLLTFTGEFGHEQLLESLWSWPPTDVCLNTMNDAVRVGNDIASRSIRFVELVEKVVGYHDVDKTGNEEWKAKIQQIWDDPLSMEQSIVMHDEDPEKYFQLTKQEAGTRLQDACARCAIWLGEVLSDIM